MIFPITDSCSFKQSTLDTCLCMTSHLQCACMHIKSYESQWLMNNYVKTLMSTQCFCPLAEEQKTFLMKIPRQCCFLLKNTTFRLPPCRKLRQKASATFRKLLSACCRFCRLSHCPFLQKKKYHHWHPFNILGHTAISC